MFQAAPGRVRPGRDCGLACYVSINQFNRIWEIGFQPQRIADDNISHAMCKHIDVFRTILGAELLEQIKQCRR